MKTFSNIKALGLAALMLAPLGAHAAVDGQANALDGYTMGYAFDVGINNVDCTIDPSDCGQLMVRSSGGTVQMALILPTSLKDNTYGSNSTGYGPNDKDQSFKDLVNSDMLKITMNGNELAMDFLSGIDDKNDGPEFISGFTGHDDSATEAGKPSWAIAAASSMEFNYNASSPDGVNAPAHFAQGADSPGAGDAALAFWENTHTYEWEVQASIFENGLFSIDQVSITDIHLSPKKTEYDNTPDIVDCPPNDPSGCIPNCDPSTDPNGCTTQCDPQTDPDGCNPPTDVPVPGTLVLMLMGLGILGSRKIAVRKSRKIMVSRHTG